MANTTSALKAWRQSLRRRARNRSQRQAVRTQFRKATAAISTNLEAAAAEIKAAISGIDRAAQKGIVHPNNAARHKSRLMKKYNASQAKAEVAAAAEEAPAKPARRRRTTKAS